MILNHHKCFQIRKLRGSEVIHDQRVKLHKSLDLKSRSTMSMSSRSEGKLRLPRSTTVGLTTALNQYP